MIYEHFRSTGSHDGVQGLSDLFSIRLQNDYVQDFDVRWDQALLSSNETPTEKILEGLYKSKITGVCTVSDHVGILQPGNNSKWRTTRLSSIEDVSKSAC